MRCASFPEFNSNARRIRTEFLNPRQCATTNLCTGHCQWTHTQEKKTNHGNIKRDIRTNSSTHDRPAACPPSPPREPGNQGTREPRNQGTKEAGNQGNQANQVNQGTRETRETRETMKPGSATLCFEAFSGSYIIVKLHPPHRMVRAASLRRASRTATQRFVAFPGTDHRTACSEPLRSVAARTATQRFVAFPGRYSIYLAHCSVGQVKLYLPKRTFSHSAQNIAI